MILQVNKEEIIEGLQKASGIIPTKTGAAYLRSLWMKAEDGTLTLMATDANIEFIGVYPANITENGLTGINGRNFVDLIRRLPSGELRFTIDGAGATSMIVEQGRRTYKLPSNDPTWFQALAPFPQEGAVLWSGDIFQDMIDRVFFCISDQEDADAIGCMYIKPLNDGKIDVCGLNGHQFALASFVHDDLAKLLPSEGIIIQRKYVSELRKWLSGDEIEINITEKRLFLRSGNGHETLSLPLATTYTYPDYTIFLERLKNEGTSNCIVDRKEMLEALDRIALFNSDNDICTYFDISAQEVILSAQGQNTGSANESLEIRYDGSIERIAFPTKNLMEILGHYSSQELKLAFTSAEGPCGISGNDDPEYTVIIMPMKITEQNYYTEEA